VRSLYFTKFELRWAVCVAGPPGEVVGHAGIPNYVAQTAHTKDQPVDGIQLSQIFERYDYKAPLPRPRARTRKTLEAGLKAAASKDDEIGPSHSRHFLPAQDNRGPF